MREMARHRPELDAVFCNNDDLALGALFGAQKAGISVPDQLGIAGFNDLEMMQAACPSLTSIRTDRYGIGRHAVNMVRAVLEGTPPPEKIVDLGFELQKRQSTDRHRQMV